MIACPNCRTETVTRALPAFGAPDTIAVEACTACSLFWFDRSGSISLRPWSVIELFRFIGKVPRDAARNPLRNAFECPRCSGPLALTHDLQRSTRFTHWRCALDQGQLITFHQFLRQKNFIRTPTSAEIAKLRATLRVICCSQCGAPVDLESEAACRHCGAAIALIDPDGIANALRDYEHAAARTPDPAAARAAIAEAAVNAIAAEQRARESREGPGGDLVAAGASALEAWFVRLLKEA